MKNVHEIVMNGGGDRERDSNRNTLLLLFFPSIMSYITVINDNPEVFLQIYAVMQSEMQKVLHDLKIRDLSYPSERQRNYRKRRRTYYVSIRFGAQIIHQRQVHSKR